MYQPFPSGDQPSVPLRPRAPASVLIAAKLMYAGAAIGAVQLIIGLALISVDIKAAAHGQFLGHSLTAPQMRPVIITLWIVLGLIGIALPGSARQCCTTASPCCPSRRGWLELLRCGCSGARPPARSSSCRA